MNVSYRFTAHYRISTLHLIHWDMKTCVLMHGEIFQVVSLRLYHFLVTFLIDDAFSEF